MQRSNNSTTSLFGGKPHGPHNFVICTDYCYGRVLTPLVNHILKILVEPWEVCQVQRLQCTENTCIFAHQEGEQEMFWVGGCMTMIRGKYLRENQCLESTLI
jgi:hypothetical protein